MSPTGKAGRRADDREARIISPPVQPDLLRLVDRADEQPHLNREQLHVRQIDLDVAGDDEAFVQAHGRECRPGRVIASDLRDQAIGALRVDSAVVAQATTVNATGPTVRDRCSDPRPSARSRLQLVHAMIQLEQRHARAVRSLPRSAFRRPCAESLGAPTLRVAVLSPSIRVAQDLARRRSGSALIRSGSARAIACNARRKFVASLRLDFAGPRVAVPRDSATAQSARFMPCMPPASVQVHRSCTARADRSRGSWNSRPRSTRRRRDGIRRRHRARRDARSSAAASASPFDARATGGRRSRVASASCCANVVGRHARPHPSPLRATAASRGSADPLPESPARTFPGSRARDRGSCAASTA